MTKKSKHYGQRTCMYDENPNRRIQCPEWSFSKEFVERLQVGATQNEVTRSKYFETVVQNFFILENPNLIIASKRSYNQVYKKIKSPKMQLHPDIIEQIKDYANQSTPSMSQYIELMFANYNFKYGYEIKLKNLLKYL